MEPILSKAVLDLRLKGKNVGSLAWTVFAGVLFAQAQPASIAVFRSFNRVLLLEEKAETSAVVS